MANLNPNMVFNPNQQGVKSVTITSALEFPGVQGLVWGQRQRDKKHRIRMEQDNLMLVNT